MICIQVSLRAEANPIIESFELKPLSGNHLFPIWENESIKLIISGVGKINAGAACSYLAAIYRDEDIYGWLHVGTGRHPAHSEGTPVLIHRIIDQGRHASFSPSFSFTPPCETESCLTIEHQIAEYPDETVYDLDAAGFYSIASKLSPLEMVHVFKIITRMSDLTHRQMEELISGQMELLKDIIKAMQGLIEEIAPLNIPFLDECLKKWHFTTGETAELKSLLGRWQLLCPDHVLLSQDFLDQASAKEALHFLKDHLEALSLPS